MKPFIVAACTQVLIEGTSGGHMSIRIWSEGSSQLWMPFSFSALRMVVWMCVIICGKSGIKASRCDFPVDVPPRTFESCRSRGCNLCRAAHVEAVSHRTDVISEAYMCLQSFLLLYYVLVSNIRTQHGQIILPLTSLTSLCDGCWWRQGSFLEGQLPTSTS